MKYITANHTERRTLAFVLPRFSGGGAERVLLTLLGSLNPERWRTSLHVLDASGPFSELVPAEVPTHVLGIPRIRQAMPALIRSLRATSADTVVSTFWHINLPLLAARPLLPREVKLVVREASLPTANIATSPLPAVVGLLHRLLYRTADRVLSSSERMSRELRELGIRPETIEILRNPVDEDAIRATVVSEPTSHDSAFVAAGRLIRAKGYDRLVELFAGKDFSGDWHCTIYGEGPEEDSLRESVLKYGLEHRILFGGFVRDIWSRIACAQALILPSRWEGMPNVALEALALGTPVIATPESGGIAELAQEAPPGAVRVAAMGEEFAMAMAEVAAREPAGPGVVFPRPSLLPASYRKTEVAQRFESLLESLITTKG